MTVEELRQDAEEYGLIYADRETKQKEGEYSYSQVVKAYEQGALDFAEPREKHIEELEQKLEQTEKDLTDYQFNYPKIKDLEKENAELKKINTESLAELNHNNGELIIECTKLEKENAELKKQLDVLSDDIPWNELKDVSEVTKKLTEAKEILQLFLKLKITPCASGNSINMFQFENVCKQAEQFLSEVEK